MVQLERLLERTASNKLCGSYGDSWGPILILSHASSLDMFYLVQQIRSGQSQHQVGPGLGPFVDPMIVLLFIEGEARQLEFAFFGRSGLRQSMTYELLQAPFHLGSVGLYYASLNAELDNHCKGSR